MPMVLGILSRILDLLQNSEKKKSKIEQNLDASHSHRIDKKKRRIKRNGPSFILTHNLKRQLLQHGH